MAPKTTISREPGAGGPDGFEGPGQRIGVVGEVDDGGRLLGDELHPSGDGHGKGVGRVRAACSAAASTPPARTITAASAALATLKLPGSPVWRRSSAPSGPLRVNSVPRPAGFCGGHRPVCGGACPSRAEGGDRDPGGAGKAAAPLVVDRHYGLAGARRREELGLGGEVVIHGAVQVQVVLGQVGETGDVEQHAVHALVGDGVGGNLHGCRVQSPFPHECQQPVDFRGFGGGQQAGNGLPAGEDLDGADQAGPLPRERSSELMKYVVVVLPLVPVTPNSAKCSSAPSVLPVDQRGERAHHVAGFVHHQDGHRGVVRQRQQPRTGVVGQDGHRPRFHGLCHEVSAVAGSTGQGDVQVSGFHGAGVQRDSRYRDPCRMPRNRDAYGFADAVQPDRVRRRRAGTGLAGRSGRTRRCCGAS